MFGSIRESYDSNGGTTQADILRELGRPWLLVYDDVGTANVKSMDWHQSIMYEILDARYSTGRPIVFTTNLGPPALAERLGPRNWSRLQAMGVGLQLDGPDRRELK